jgi:uncharacterized protein (TIGR02265 family)
MPSASGDSATGVHAFVACGPVPWGGVMKIRRELLDGKAAVKATILQAHLAWAQKQSVDLARVAPLVHGECAGFLTRRTLSTEWLPFRCLVEIDRAIAGTLGGAADKVFRDLGRHSASVNLGGVYKGFISSEPHRVFAQMSALHRQFQDFGRWDYQATGDRSGKIVLQDYPEYSPSYCTSAAGYFEEALRIMRAPGPIVVREPACQCAGDPHCLYEMSW